MVCVSCKICSFTVYNSFRSSSYFR